MFLIALVILFLPLITFLGLIFTQKLLHRFAGKIALGVLIVMTLLSFYLFSQQWGKEAVFYQIPWFSLNRRIFFNVDLRLDSLGVAMLCLVTFIASLVHLFSLEYMRGEQNYTRYFAYLGLFTFAMLGIVLSDNLLITYFFWELVGLSSYLLIGFWHRKESANRAAQKAFLINRIGDVGLLVGIITVWLSFNTFQISEVEHLLFSGNIQGEISNFYFSLMGLGLFCGAVGKSAQFPLQVWLPDAMEGPTPVSALIHAATMVAAGVFFVARIFFLLNISIFVIIAFIGTITAVLGALSALIQKDLKKVLAYSTISQLGYMMMGMGVGAYSSSLLHLFTHAFFKAGLFLGAGAIIHVLHEVAHKQNRHFDAQNMYLMGGLSKRMPFTAVCFLVFSCALAGLPLFSGFLSKDAILSGAWAWAEVMSQKGSFVFYLVPILGFLTAMLTALYVGRMLLLVFIGKFNLDILNRQEPACFPHIQDPPMTMKIPLGLLAMLSLFLFFSFNPFSGEESWLMKGLTTPQNFFLGTTIQTQLHQTQVSLHTLSALLSVFFVLLGLGLAYWLDLKERFMKNTFNQYARSFYRWSYYGFFQDRFYRRFLVKPTLEAADATPEFDQMVFNLPLHFMVRFGLKLARGVSYFDQLVVDGIVILFARTQVVLAHVLAWLDRTFVDGTLHLFVYLIGFIGSQTRSLQGGKVQSYFIGIIVLFCAFILWLVWS
jgi:NADH-quinone oxidoreductase subunit L